MSKITEIMSKLLTTMPNNFFKGLMAMTVRNCIAAEVRTSLNFQHCNKKTNISEFPVLSGLNIANHTDIFKNNVK